MAAPDRNILYPTIMIRMITSIQKRASGLTIEQFVDDSDEIDLMSFRLSQIGEYSVRLDQLIRDAHPEIDWANMRGLRNLVVHEYHRVAPERIWRSGLMIKLDNKDKAANQ